MKRWINNSNRDYYAGALMFALGIGAILEGRKYSWEPSAGWAWIFPGGRSA